MIYKFITQKSSMYQQAVDLRILLFFKGMENANELINDSLEAESLHLVCLLQEKLIGTGRLTIQNKIAIVSQMAIDTDFQYQGIGNEILTILTEKSKDLNTSEIILSARESAIKFYKKNGFEVIGEKYPSVKTGIIHQKMKKKN